MLSREEKAYCRAFAALKKKDYITADKEFRTCGAMFEDGRGFQIISEAARMMVVLQEEKNKLLKIQNNIKESFNNGEETIVRR